MKSDKRNVHDSDILFMLSVFIVTAAFVVFAFALI